MSYMHKETFDITQYDIGSNEQNFFEIDELIALPVQVLNRKGYITEAACAGHQFERFEDTMLIIERCHTYIMFKEGISLPSLPFGFFKDDSHIKIFPQNLKITREFGDISGTFKFLREVFESMEQLYQWALDLPDFKN